MPKYVKNVEDVLPVLPVEIWSFIMLFVTERTDLLNISLVSRYFHDLVNTQLWERLKLPFITKQILSIIIHKPIKELYLQNSACNNLHLELIGKILTINKLCLDGNAEITDAGFSNLATLTNLQFLSFNVDQGKCKVTSVGLKHIVNLPIEELSFGTGSCDNYHLSVIGYIVTLRVLDISGSCWSNKFTDEGLSYLANLTQLEDLDISQNCFITSTGLEYIAHLPLKHLRFMSSNCNDKHLEVIGKMRMLRTLSVNTLSPIYATGITDQGLSYLVPLTELEYLDLGECPKITKQGVACLVKSSLEIDTLDHLLPPYGPTPWLL